MKYRKKIVAKVGLMTFGLAVGIIMLEVALRMLGLYSVSDMRRIDPETGLVTFQPDAQLPVKAECIDTTVVTNSLGFHSREYERHKPEGVYRIVLVGDSFVEAMQVDRDSSFSARLEDMLNTTDGLPFTYEVIPFGMSARGTYLNLHYLNRYGLAFEPDLVVNAFLVENDVWDDFFNGARSQPPEFDASGALILPSDGSVYREEDSVLERFVKRYVIQPSAVAQLLYKKYMIIQADRLRATKALDTDNALRRPSIYYQKYPETWKEAWRKESILLNTFKQISDQHAAQFLLLSLAEGYRVHQELYEQLPSERKDITVYDYTRPEQLLAAIAYEHDFPYHSVLPYFKERAAITGELTVWPCDGHWNELGHQWAAESLLNFLLENPDLIGISSSSNAQSSN